VEQALHVVIKCSKSFRSALSEMSGLQEDALIYIESFSKNQILKNQSVFKKYYCEIIELIYKLKVFVIYMK
jgi:hypothetical protein